MYLLSIVFFVLATVGLFLVALQTEILRRFLKQPALTPTRPMPPISILKPLSGMDDELEKNLESFAALDYPDYEVLLGMQFENDTAMPVAKRMVERFPNRFRIVMQNGEPGLNPKVNQLITLAREARHNVLLSSDASVRAGLGYLPEIAAHLEDPGVGMVTHLLAGCGEQSLGSLFDNLYLMSHFTGGAIAAKKTQGHDFVNGKSITFRRADLDAMGGFDAVKDYGTEDYALGKWVSRVLGRRVVFARYVLNTMSIRRSVADYMMRYKRWAIFQRTGEGFPLYFLQTMMYPLLLASFALLLFPSTTGLGLWCAIAIVKASLDCVHVKMLRPGPVPLKMLLLGPVNDMIVAWTWFHGLLHDRTVWRGHVLQVTRSIRLVPLHPDEIQRTEASPAVVEPDAEPNGAEL